MLSGAPTSIASCSSAGSHMAWHMQAATSAGRWIAAASASPREARPEWNGFHLRGDPSAAEQHVSARSLILSLLKSGLISIPLSALNTPRVVNELTWCQNSTIDSETDLKSEVGFILPSPPPGSVGAAPRVHFPCCYILKTTALSGILVSWKIITDNYLLIQRLLQKKWRFQKKIHHCSSSALISPSFKIAAAPLKVALQHPQSPT